VNVTEDSFSDGGRYLDADRAIEHALGLVAAGADAIDLGPASSHPDSRDVSADEEIRRLTPVIERLHAEGVVVSVDSPRPQTQAWALERGAAFLNDITGFPDPSRYPELARASCGLVVMHSVRPALRAERERTEPEAVLRGMYAFFAERIAALEAAGVARDRLILDPGMGFFLGNGPEPSLRALQELPALATRFELPLLVSVSRKSFLGVISGRPRSERGAATLAAELYLADSGVQWIRTHDVAALADALAVRAALGAGRARDSC